MLLNHKPSDINIHVLPMYNDSFTHCKTKTKFFFSPHFFFHSSSVAFLATSTCSNLNTASTQLKTFMSSTIKFIKILFPFPNKFIIIYFIYFLFPVLHYVLITKHTNHTNQSQYITISTHHNHDHTSFMLCIFFTQQVIKSHTKHTCSVLVLCHAFLGNLIPIPNIKPPKW